MSRREKEGHDSYSKRLHSRSERDPSPNKSRRDGKQATERTYYITHHLDVETLDRDQKKQRSLQDALPLEIPRGTETKMQPETLTQGLEKVDELHDATKHSSELREVPRSRSYFQHDERGSAGNGGRSWDRRTTDHRRERDPKEHSRERFRDKTEHQERQSRVDDSKVWRHDGFFELETAAQPARKRPAFREKKIEAPPETTPAANESEPSKLSTARREESVRERARHHRRLENRYDRLVPRGDDERNFKRGDGHFQRGGYQLRERFGDGGTKGRDRFEGRYGDRSMHRPSGGFQLEKWEHDLFNEANRSPKAKNYEEEIAKVEALLAL